ncbi:putative ABC transport system permease protein [Flavobacteriaceae bacterium MAR_2010_188]|nr:putative ABC transport system permease protein [Flavobacteriaceae bacterium MAR_2010_188]
MLVYLRLFKESFAFALNALRNNKLRTFLSLLGITIGIFSIIAILAAVDSLERNIADQLSGLDSNTMYVSNFSFGPTDVPKWKRENFPRVNYDDYEFVRRSVPDINSAAFAVMFASPENIKYEDVTLTNVNVQPVSNEISEIDDLKLANGRFYNESESNSGAPVIVLGHSIAENLFKSLDPIGKQIRVYGRKVTVVGVLEKFGVNLGDSPDEKAWVPVNFYRGFNNGGVDGLMGAIVLKPNSDADIGAFEEVLTQKLRAHRALKPEEIDNFFISKISGMKDAIAGIFTTMNLVGWVISGFSLLVGGFGIANIMFVSVKERTNLIGIQKSLGAKNRFILFQFLFEAVILALVGGIIGLILVWLITIVASQFTGDFKFVLSFGNMFLGFMLSTFIGLISGVLPALSASKLDPVEAIRTGM